MNHRKDIPNEGRNIRIMTIVSITLLLLAFACTGQINTSVYPDGTKYKYTAPLYFGDANKQDKSICLNITADSLGYKNYKIQMTLRTPSDIGKCDVKIGFADGSYEYLVSKYFIDGINSNIYELTESQVNKLRSLKYDYVGFETDKSITSCITIKHPTFFTDFLNNYYK